MSNPYPNRDLEELYLEHASIWDEVLAGELSPESALAYMRIPEESSQWFRVRRALREQNPPL
jgi:hypothetical protein